MLLLLGFVLAAHTATPGNEFADNVVSASSDEDAGTLLGDNDRAIAENKWLIKKLTEYQGANFQKYQRLRSACKAKVGGTLADAAASQVARCIWGDGNSLHQSEPIERDFRR